MADYKKQKVLYLRFCDFCGASDKQRDVLVQGRDQVHICEECAVRCNEMFAEFRQEQRALKLESPQAAPAVESAVESGQV